MDLYSKQSANNSPNYTNPTPTGDNSQNIQHPQEAPAPITPIPNQPPGKGAESFPSNIETYKPEIAVSPEIQKAPETIPQPKEAQKQTPLEDESTVQPEQSAPEDMNVVDRTDELTTLHDIKTRNKMTDRADEEEEEFIKGVETAHGRDQ